MDKNFNMLIVGVGGQGLITLVSILNQAAFYEGYDVRSSELHGLSQRGGSVETHIRFGKKIYSPLVTKPDLILGLEILESLRAKNKAVKTTKFLVNDYILPFNNDAVPSLEGFEIVPASAVCKKEFGNEVVAGIYLLGYAISHGLIPLKKESVLGAIEAVVPSKHLELNIKAFNHG